MKKEEARSYAVRVKGASLTDWRGAVPESIDALIKKPNKDTATLYYQIIKTQVELFLQQGKTDEAMEAVKKYEELEYAYAAPLNTFKKDLQNGGAPYQGAHCFFGAFRDAAGSVFELYYKKKWDDKPSDKHLRKYVRVMPNHIFLYRNADKILEPDGIEGQQPVDDVKGFARYEVIHHPFTFDFVVQILAAGKFKEFLSDRNKVLEAIYCSSFNGQGACRSAGYGGWKVVEASVGDWLVTQG